MKNIILTIIIVLLILFALSNLAAFVGQTAVWESRYGMYSEDQQMVFAFLIFMMIVIVVGVVYLWWIKAL